MADRQRRGGHRIAADAGLVEDGEQRIVEHVGFVCRELAERLLGAGVSSEDVVVSNARHRARLESAAAELRQAIATVDAGFEQAMVAVDLKIAAGASLETCTRAAAPTLGSCLSGGPPVDGAFSE